VEFPGRTEKNLADVLLQALGFILSSPLPSGSFYPVPARLCPTSWLRADLSPPHLPKLLPPLPPPWPAPPSAPLLGSPSHGASLCRPPIFLLGSRPARSMLLLLAASPCSLISPSSPLRSPWRFPLLALDRSALPQRRASPAPLVARRASSFCQPDVGSVRQLSA
jgi:hypothetical protein